MRLPSFTPGGMRHRGSLSERHLFGMRSKVPDHERAKGAYDRNDWVSEFRRTSLSLESVPLRHVTRYTTTHDPVTKEPSMPQTEVPIERRFHGSVNLVILHLRRVAQSNDIDTGLAAARQLHLSLIHI